MNFTKPLNASTTPPCWYSPDTNPRQKLRNYAKHISPELYTIFRTPILDEREYHLFDLLKRGYIDAHYKPDYRKETQGRVFERFYRDRDPRIDTYPGLGLGLYIAAEIARRHYGGITVDSQPGAGSTFCFSFPINPGSRPEKVQ